MDNIDKARKVVRRLWSFSSALDLALIDEEVKKGFQLEIGERHGERVGYISVRIGHILGIRDRDLFLLLVAGLMHDIGTVGGFADYHGNPRLMQEHSEIGARILKEFPGGKMLEETILHHHQTPRSHQYDSLYSKIISLADKVDIIMGRKFLDFKDRAKVLNYVNSLVGKEFYPEAVEAFRQLVGEEAFWLHLREGNLLEPTMDFLFGRRCIQDGSGLNDICNVMYGEVFTDKLAETFGQLIDQKSSFTARHSKSVAETAAALAMELGWKSDDIRDIKLAGFLHDLGKLAVPQRILDKPGALSNDEFQLIRTHPYYTYNLLTAAGFPRNIAEWAGYHHERLDGKGYPFHIQADYLDIGVRLMTIADMFNALIEERPYRKPMSKEEAFGIMEKNVGKNVDGELLKLAKGVLL